MINNSKYEEIINRCESELEDRFKEFDEIRKINQHKIIKAMQDVQLSHADFHWTTGYGYADIGREKVEKIYSKIFKSEDALVRPNIASGTHALALTLEALLLPGDEMLSISGRPYDTLQKVIGITGNEVGNLREYGISYEELELIDGKIDISGIESKVKNNTKLILIQRSMGYTARRAHTISEIELAIKKVRKINKDIIIMVDNCYGEFTSIYEPIEIGADIAVGSLIKNPGGGISLSGGYIVGDEELIERCANKLTAPGLCKDCGLTFGMTRPTLQGLFYAPIAVNNALKGAVLIGKVFSELGFKTIPSPEDIRSDIVQGIIFGNPESVISFCQAIQKASAVDSHVKPYPWEMPGYEDKVIMAAGGFVDGSSIEISADGPLRDPYMAFYQGGVSYDQCKMALGYALQDLDSIGVLKF
ncbi:MAG: methionine gamma-lyase family protein [Tissierellia bacterium]|nr:methionine gamma-lyase family protein [Tissierellia bacterium]